MTAIKTLAVLCHTALLAWLVRHQRCNSPSARGRRITSDVTGRLMLLITCIVRIQLGHMVRAGIISG